MYYKLHFNVVERLKYYMKLRNMNAYQLTQKTQLSENTIPTCSRRKTDFRAWTPCSIFFRG